MAFLGSHMGHEDLIGVYSTEEAALKAVELVSCDDAYAWQCVLDEHPTWLHDLIADRGAFGQAAAQR